MNNENPLLTSQSPGLSSVAADSWWRCLLEENGAGKRKTVGIGDLSSLDRKLAERADRKLKSFKQSDRSKVETFLKSKTEGREQKSAGVFERFSGSYNCDPINDPKYVRNRTREVSNKEAIASYDVTIERNVTSSSFSHKTLESINLPKLEAGDRDLQKGAKFEVASLNVIQESQNRVPKVVVEENLDQKNSSSSTGLRMNDSVKAITFTKDGDSVTQRYTFRTFTNTASHTQQTHLCNAESSESVNRLKTHGDIPSTESTKTGKKQPESGTTLNVLKNLSFEGNKTSQSKCIEDMPLCHSLPLDKKNRQFNCDVTRCSSAPLPTKNCQRCEAICELPASRRRNGDNEKSSAEKSKPALNKDTKNCCGTMLGKKVQTQRYENLSTFNEKMKNRRRSDIVINSTNDKHQRPPPLQHHHQNTERQRPTARRAAVVSTLPDSDLSCLSDTIANLQRNQPVGLSSDLKRSKWTFPRLAFMNKDKDRNRDETLEDYLTTWKPSTVDQSVESRVQTLKECNVDEKMSSRPSSTSSSSIHLSSRQWKRSKAVWELFASERTYLVDHLLVMLQVFMEPLQDLQCEGFLLSVDVRAVFGNLEELCKVTLDFCQTLLKVVGGEHPGHFGSAAAIDEAFKTFESTVCPPYQRYFSGYNNSLSDRDSLKSNEYFLLFLKWCEKNPRCQRLTLNDFLVAPMQHLTKYPLLLRNIARYTDDKYQNSSIESTLAVVQEALKTVEGKVTSNNHYQFLQDLQASITWPPVYELDVKTILPEGLKNLLSRQPCQKLIANPKRQLILQDHLTVIENGKPFETYAFLFDDMLLLTKPKKGKRKVSEVPSSLKRHELMKDGTLLTVHRQPIAMDRFMMYDIDGEQASAMGMKRAFVLVQENRFQQMFSITLLQASTEESKRKWLTNLASTAAQWMEENVFENCGKALVSNGSFHHSLAEEEKQFVKKFPPPFLTSRGGLDDLDDLDEILCNGVENHSNGRDSSISGSRSDDSDYERSDFL